MSDVLYSHTKPRINLFIFVSINIMKYHDMIVTEIIKITSVLTGNLQVINNNYVNYIRECGGSHYLGVTPDLCISLASF